MKQGLIEGENIGEILSKEAGSLKNLYVRKSQAEKYKDRTAEIFRKNSENDNSPKLDIILLPEIFNAQSDHGGIKFVPESPVFK